MDGIELTEISFLLIEISSAVLVLLWRRLFLTVKEGSVVESRWDQSVPVLPLLLLVVVGWLVVIEPLLTNGKGSIARSVVLRVRNCPNIPVARCRGFVTDGGAWRWLRAALLSGKGTYKRWLSLKFIELAQWEGGTVHTPWLKTLC
ncbi:hypothetical protein GQ602_000472 [Ophiocordyceps camponoti-floridani]|uniref:Uncharacterized protein n=1 Tax=Ophiocordyceps camponoti-floridani TaxID=2030778 RepID=A0A8H4QC81_9HYPO|nr:hypothetical protein GQ602_000472 [Ophiocordyceps camponoti-floridani]